MWTNDAGSSSVLSIRLAASSPSSSARSMTNTRRADSNGVRDAAEMTGPSMSDTSISCAPLGDDPRQVRMRPRPDARASALLVGRALGQQLGRERSGRGALAGPTGAVEQVPVRRSPWMRERRGEHRARVGMAVELCEHASILALQ